MLYAATEKQVWSWLEEVPDPEIPVVSIVDLGIIRRVSVNENGVEIEVSPTYSGCPATEVIETSILERVRNGGVESVVLKRVLSPPWTTDWISKSGREKLREYGIAPPVGSATMRELKGKPAVCCPRCGTSKTTVIAEFGSTACKASCKCDECLEPFEYFKCI
jgi:ring-1,2-phenylacetyl-CoA epoxidase subunit PaaD